VGENEKNFDKFKKFFRELKDGCIYSWKEISKIHKSRNGIYQRKGHLISLLTDFGRINPCYPDVKYEKNKILYTGAGRRGNQKLDIFNQALMNAINSGHAVPLFCKEQVGHWRFLGFWRVTKAEYVFDKKQQRMIWRFLLEKSEL
jgi:restriction endonuclease S subunit